MIEPHAARGISGPTIFDSQRLLNTLFGHQSARRPGRSGRPMNRKCGLIAALHTRMSTRPHSARVAGDEVFGAASGRRCARSPRSPRRPSADRRRHLVAGRLVARRDHHSGSRFGQNPRRSPRPMPRDEPVTIATLPLRSNSFIGMASYSSKKTLYRGGRGGCAEGATIRCLRVLCVFLRAPAVMRSFDWVSRDYAPSRTSGLRRMPIPVISISQTSPCFQVARRAFGAHPHDVAG